MDWVWTGSCLGLIVLLLQSVQLHVHHGNRQPSWRFPFLFLPLKQPMPQKKTREKFRSTTHESALALRTFWFGLDVSSLRMCETSRLRRSLPLKAETLAETLINCPYETTNFSLGRSLPISFFCEGTSLCLFHFSLKRLVSAYFIIL